jgi:hypothetical protein
VDSETGRRKEGKIAMSEDPLRIMKELLSEINKVYNESDTWLQKREPEANENIETYGKIRDSRQTDPSTRQLAAYATYNECNILVILAMEKNMLNLMNRLAISTVLTIMHIDNELKQIKKPSISPTEMDSEKISTLEKELARLKRVTKQWKPIIDDFREGRERTKKYLRDHR